MNTIAITTQVATPDTRHPGRPITDHAYAADWQAFAAWYAVAGQSALPATAAAYLESCADRIGPTKHPTGWALLASLA